VHFISYERPFRLSNNLPRVHFHPVVINDYELFKYPDYTLPLSVRMEEVCRDHGLDILHVHYAVPHATAAILAREMLPRKLRPAVVTTLHGTDTTLLGRDPGYGPAIHHALKSSDAVTTVSDYLREETRSVLGYKGPLQTIHNFFTPRAPQRSREEVRGELGVGKETLIIHSSNLRPLKRVDLVLEAAARIRPRNSFKLLILAGGNFAPFARDVRRLGLEGRVIVREQVNEIEDYLQAADMGLFASEAESFGLAILEAMCFGCPSVATRVGGVPEVIDDGQSGILVPHGDVEVLAGAVEKLIKDPAHRKKLGASARHRARKYFSAEAIVTQYEELYLRVTEKVANRS
jgi:N-acetyl-alpha-D-glucosaminyl L-malate synthase BshA